MLPRTLTSLAVLAGLLAAQGRVIIVDANNGPGTDFLDVPPAMAAATDGDVVRVRPGDYTQFRVDKGIAVVGGPGVRVTIGSFVNPWAIEVVGLGPNQHASVAGFDTTSALPFSTRFRVSGCQSRVLLERLVGRTSGTIFGTGFNAELIVEQSRQVAIAHSSLTGQPAVHAIDSEVLVSDSECIGTDGFAGHGEAAAGAGIRAERAHVVVSRSRLEGGDLPTQGFLVRPMPALVSTDSTWVVTAEAGARIVAGAVTGVAVPAIEGSGAMRLHPEIVLVPSGGGPPVSGPIAITSARTPSLATEGAVLGGTVTVDLFSDVGDTVGLLVGQPGDRFSLGALGDAYLDPTGFLALVAVGVQGAGRHFAHTVPVPMDPNLLGARFAWQGLSGTAAGFLLSNPASYVH